MVALHSGVGQVVDVNLLESMLQMMGPLISLNALTGEQQPRLGGGLPYTVPRGHLSMSRREVGGGVDEQRQRRGARARVARAWVTTSGSPGSPDGRDHRVELEALMSAWCSTRTQAEVVTELAAADAAVGPVMDMADIGADPHIARPRHDRARG